MISAGAALRITLPFATGVFAIACATGSAIDSHPGYLDAGTGGTGATDDGAAGDDGGDEAGEAGGAAGSGGASGAGGAGGSAGVGGSGGAAGAGGSAIPCDSFCGQCACPSTECTMCCSQQNMVDACHSGTCSCY